MTTQSSGLRKKLAENLAKVRENIASAAAKVERDPDKITLLAVTKTVGLDVIRMLVDLGQYDFGESRVQQLVQSAGMLSEQLARRTMLEDADVEKINPRWHMIGHLQRNKVKAALSLTTLVHSVDNLRLAEEINMHSGRLGLSTDVLVQVNCSGESQKYGMPVAAVGHFVEQVMGMPNIRPCGLMTMAALAKSDADIEKTRLVFERLYELFLEVKMEHRLGSEFEHLSMGMSQDYHIAVECGATIVRVGSALFEGIESQSGSG